MSNAFTLSGNAGKISAIVAALFLFDRDHGPLDMSRVAPAIQGTDDCLRVEIVYESLLHSEIAFDGKVLLFDLVHEHVYEYRPGANDLRMLSPINGLTVNYVSPHWPEYRDVSQLHAKG